MGDDPTVSDVWNEVRFTSDGISVTLFSEGTDGVVVEDELWYTFDEMKSMAPSEPQSLNLSEESRQGMDGTLSFEEVREEVFNEDHEYKTTTEEKFSEGDTVVDTDAPSWSEDARMVVEEVTDTKAKNYVIEDKWNGELTVARANAEFPEDDRVIEAHYVDGSDDTYAFPESRIGN